MSFTSLQSKQLRSMALAFGLMFFGAFASAWGAVPNVGHNADQELSTTRVVAMGIGAIGGVLAYCAITGDWTLGGMWGLEAAAASVAAPAATTATGVGAVVAAPTTAALAAAPAATVAQTVAAAPNAAAQFVAAWGGRQVFIPASAILGSLIGDWIYSSN